MRQSNSNRFTQGWLSRAMVLVPFAFSAYATCAHASQKQDGVTYSCASPAKGVIALSSTTTFTPTRAGFDIKAAPAISGTAGGAACTSDQAFFFSAPLPEGNYRVTVVLGGPEAAVTTVRGEMRRLMVEKVSTAPHASETRTFDLNVRVPEFGEGSQIKLGHGEVGNLDWDKKLTLEFNGDHPSVRSISIQPIAHEPVLYIAGDSTVVDQPSEPWTAWGQILPRFFQPGIAIADHAQSGETIASFNREQRFDKVFSLIQPGDYFFLQFNHNDRRIDPVTHQPLVPLDEYKRLLVEFIDRTQKAGATPVLVTAMNRRSFDATGHIVNTLGDYADVMREVAKQKNVTLIDLNAMSKVLFEAMGPDGTLKAFMHYPMGSFPGQTKEYKDDVHFNGYGAYELARCMVMGIRASKLPIAKFLDSSVPPFDPAHPDSVTAVALPVTPLIARPDTEAMK
jgi:lysophospholipase L1-like esterase